jgi:hypothetical protein
MRAALSVRCLCGLLVLAAGAALPGCSSGETSAPPAAAAQSSGRVALALTTRGASGSLYRLREAAFQVSEQSSDPFGGFFTFLFSEDDPLSSTLETTLETGDYSVELFPGWVLEKVENGEVNQVQASLLSDPIQFFSILPDDETFVGYRFETGGEIIEFEQGRLVIDIQVEERAPVQLGEPLEIVDGFVSRGSNPHGIQAELFVVTSERAATIEVREDSGSLCFSGQLEPVLDGDFSTQWGALVGLSFVSDELENAPWDLDGGRVTGFAFSVSGPELPPLRFGALPSSAPEATFCAPLFLGSPAFEVPFTSMTRDCWEAGGAPLVTSELLNIAWTLPTDAVVSHPFDFCIDDVRPILR